MMSPSPLVPAALGQRLSRSLLPRALVFISALAIAGCYTGTEIPEGSPWGGDDAGDDAADGADGGDGADDGGDGGGTGGSADSAGDGADGADGADSADSGGLDSVGDMGESGDSGGLDSGGDTGGTPADVPDIPYCNDVATWDSQWVQFELDILDLVNMYRASGATCGGQPFGATGALTMNPELRCSARVHSKDMNDRNFFDHTNPSGQDPFDRMQLAGYDFTAAGENIAGGSSDAAGTMNQWMNSTGHCQNIMNPSYTELGVGYYPGGQFGTLWTQNFGRP